MWDFVGFWGILGGFGKLPGFTVLLGLAALFNLGNSRYFAVLCRTFACIEICPTSPDFSGFLRTLGFRAPGRDLLLIVVFIAFTFVPTQPKGLLVLHC